MHHHLYWTSNTDCAATDIVFWSLLIRASRAQLCALLVALLFGPTENRRGCSGRKMTHFGCDNSLGCVHNRHVPQFADVLFDCFGVVGPRSYQIVKRCHPPGCYRRQRYGYLRVMHRSSGQYGADRNLSIGYVQMQLVSTPVLAMSLAAQLRSKPAETCLTPRSDARHFRHPAQLLLQHGREMVLKQCWRD
jgi:hypothetical protein